MDRRSFVFVAAAITLSSSLIKAGGAYPPIGMPGQAFVDHPQLVQQKCAEWCWAASASMIFGSAGHPTDQIKIVETVYRGLNCGAQDTGIITEILNATWTDDRGETFQSEVEAGFDQAHGITAIKNAFIINELMQDRPLLYANTHHCMVIVEADYIATPLGQI